MDGHGISPRERIASFDGSQLFHAYGQATDAGRLAGLFADEDARDEATDYLFSAILHQGTPWTATAPVVDLLVDCLAHDDASGARETIFGLVSDVAEVDLSTDPGTALDDSRAALQKALADLGPAPAAAWAKVAASGDEDAYMATFADPAVSSYSYLTALLGICVARPRWARAIMPFMSDADPQVALAAARAVAASDPRQAPEVVRSLAARTASGAPTWQRGYAVHLLGQLGEDVTGYLADDEPVVRFLAALAPALADDQVADSVIVEAMRDPAGLDREFAEAPPLPDLLDWAPSMAAIGRVVSRAEVSPVLGPDVLVDVAIASARHTAGLPGDWAWGRFLEPVLRGATPGEPLDPEQRRYLGALVALNRAGSEIWSRSNGNNLLVFRSAGLPHDRRACQELVDGAAWTPVER